MLLNIDCMGHRVISSNDVTKCQNEVSFFKVADVNAGYLLVKLGLLKRLHPKYARKRIQYPFVYRIDKSGPRVTVWHHSADPCDAKQRPSRQNRLSYPQTR